MEACYVCMGKEVSCPTLVLTISEDRGLHSTVLLFFRFPANLNFTAFLQVSSQPELH